jgi:hypothetical protein
MSFRYQIEKKKKKKPTKKKRTVGINASGFGFEFESLSHLLGVSLLLHLTTASDGPCLDGVDAERHQLRNRLENTIQVHRFFSSLFRRPYSKSTRIEDVDVTLQTKQTITSCLDDV